MCCTSFLVIVLPLLTFLTPSPSFVPCVIILFLPQLRLTWQTPTKSPEAMRRGAAFVHGNNVYLVSKGCKIYCFQVETDKWLVYPPCPHHNPGLAIINNLLTAIGGREHGAAVQLLVGERATRKLVSCKDGKWVQHFSPMKYARCGHTVMSDDRCIVAAGGHGESSIEIYNIDTNIWSVLTNFPHVDHPITATLCDDHICIMDHFGRVYVYTKALHLFLSGEKLPPRDYGWKCLPRAPVMDSTLSTMCGQVIAVGGRRRGNIPVKDVYQLCKEGWVTIEHMDIARFDTIVAVSGNRMIVVGGTNPLHNSFYSGLDAVEIAVSC